MINCNNVDEIIDYLEMGADIQDRSELIGRKIHNGIQLSYQGRDVFEKLDFNNIKIDMNVSEESIIKLIMLIGIIDIELLPLLSNAIPNIDQIIARFINIGSLFDDDFPYFSNIFMMGRWEFFQYLITEFQIDQLLKIRYQDNMQHLQYEILKSMDLSDSPLLSSDTIYRLIHMLEIILKTFNIKSSDLFPLCDSDFAVWNLILPDPNWILAGDIYKGQLISWLLDYFRPPFDVLLWESESPLMMIIDIQSIELFEKLFESYNDVDWHHYLIGNDDDPIIIDWLSDCSEINSSFIDYIRLKFNIPTTKIEDLLD